MKSVWAAFIFTALLGLPVTCLAQDKNPKPITGAESFNLSPTEVTALESRYSNHQDGEAAYRLSQYYGLARFDLDRQILWLKRAARLGHPAAQYNLAYILIESDDKFKDLSKGEYWLNKAEESARSTHDSGILDLIPGLREELKKSRD
jgi:TPR repeat protein